LIYWEKLSKRSASVWSLLRKYEACPESKDTSRVGR